MARCLSCVEGSPVGDYLYCRECALARMGDRDRVLREAVLDHYGRSCACCGATDDLQVDHIQGGGARHMLQLGGQLRHRSTGGPRITGVHIARWLVSEGFPSGFQILCGPCNRSKGRGTQCHIPHTTKAPLPQG